MCICFNIRTPPKHNKPNPKDPTNPKPKTLPPDPDPTPSLAEEVDRASFPPAGGRLSAARAQAMCMATSEAFSSVAKVEAAFIAYSNGKIVESEQLYQQAIEHAQELMSWLAKMQSDVYEHLLWFDTQNLDPLVEDLIRQINSKDVSALLLHLGETSEPTEIWKAIERSVQKDGYHSLLTAGVSDLPLLQSVARDLLVSLDLARSSIRNGELFEALFYRLEPTYLEQTFNELISALLRLNLIANCSAAIDRMAAQRRIAQGIAMNEPSGVKESTA